MSWAWIPAGILGLIGLFILIAKEDLLNYIWPIALMIGGLQLIIRAFRRK
jgi:multisubunit Na+/H+ antiporter MnhC subunit